jgi:hypothetical protein
VYDLHADRSLLEGFKSGDQARYAEGFAKTGPAFTCVESSLSLRVSGTATRNYAQSADRPLGMSGLFQPIPLKVEFGNIDGSRGELFPIHCWA